MFIMSIHRIYHFIFLLLTLSIPLLAHANEKAPVEFPSEELLNMELAALFDIEVISATKKKQLLSDTPAAISVITADDIKRSGALHIAEALRMASGIFVAQRNSGDWFVASRGSFNSSFVNKLLVLVDGRSVYNPQLARTFWNDLNVYLEDVERIEVIRGSGGAIWGANAVNGVINIITKSSHDTRDTVVQVGKGNLVDHILSARHGGALSSHTSYRVYAQKTENNKTKNPLLADSADMKQAGFRFDSYLEADTELSIQGGVSSREADDIDIETYAPTLSKTNTHFLSAQWNRTFSDTNKLSLKSYYSYEDRSISAISLDNTIVDIDLTHQFQLSTNHAIIWGGGYRWTHYNIEEGSLINVEKLKDSEKLFNAFIQDDITLKPDLHLILGAKLEHNDYTGLEFQPNIRIAWTPHKHQTLWAAISRSVHTPALLNDQVNALIKAPPSLTQLNPLLSYVHYTGNKELKSESIISYEFGFRHSIASNLTWDTSFFYNDIKDLITTEVYPTMNPLTGEIGILNPQSNGMEGYSFGAESSLKWRTGKWQFSFNYNYLNIVVTPDAMINTTHDELEHDNPEHRFSLYTSVDITPTIQANMNIYYVSHLPKRQLDEYTNTDVNISWKINKNVHLSVIGKNLFDNQKPQYTPHMYDPLITEIPRSIYTQLRWQF